MDINTTRISQAQSIVAQCIDRSYLTWQTADKQLAAILFEDCSSVIGHINFVVCAANLMVDRLDRAIACGRPIAVDAFSCRLCPVVLVDKFEL